MVPPLRQSRGGGGGQAPATDGSDGHASAEGLPVRDLSLEPVSEGWRLNSLLEFLAAGDHVGDDAKVPLRAAHREPEARVDLRSPTHSPLPRFVRRPLAQAEAAADLVKEERDLRRGGRGKGGDCRSAPYARRRGAGRVRKRCASSTGLIWTC